MIREFINRIISSNDRVSETWRIINEILESTRYSNRTISDDYKMKILKTLKIEFLKNFNFFENNNDEFKLIIKIIDSIIDELEERNCYSSNTFHFDDADFSSLDCNHHGHSVSLPAQDNKEFLELINAISSKKENKK